MRKFVGVLLIGTAVWAGARIVRSRNAIAASLSAPHSSPRRSQLEVDVLDEARIREGDAVLNERYASINQNYFGGGLPRVAVSWEPRLDDIAATRGDGLVLEGLTDGTAIVINPSLRSDRRLLIATLCHEMVHVRLAAAGGHVGEDHGPEFQRHLRRLLDEGAFEGAFATDEQKAAMKASIFTEVAWLDQESAALSAAASTLDRERARVDHLVEELNARITRANSLQIEWPSDDEQENAKKVLAALNLRSRSHNARVAAFNRRIDAYNQAVERYNLVNAYPDGLAAARMETRPVFR